MESLSPGPVAPLSGISSTALGMEFLGSAQLASANVALFSPILPARDALLISVMVPPGRSLANTLKLTFNGLETAVYWTRTFSSAQFIGIATFTNNQTVSSTGLILDAGAPTTDAAHFFVVVSNRLATSKGAFWQGTAGSGSAGTVPTVVIGSGEFVNTTAQITTVDLACAGATMPAGTKMLICGRNYP